MRDNQLDIVPVEVVEITKKLAILRADADTLQGRPKTTGAAGGAPCDRVVITPLAEVHDGMSVRTDQAKTPDATSDPAGDALLAQEGAQQ